MSTSGVRAWPSGGDGISQRSAGSVAIAAIAVAIAGAYAVGLVATQGDPVVAAPLVGALVLFAVFVRPVVGLYLLVGAALLFEQFEITGFAPLTAQTHFFENFSTWSAIPLRLSASDLLALITLASWAVRRAVGANEPARAGPLGRPIVLYGASFVFAAVVGAARGGGWDPIVMLAEARGALYLCLLYFLAANLIRERGQVIVLLWEFVVIVGVKGLQGIGNYVQMLSGPDRFEAVTAHEDVVFFDVAIVLLLLMVALRVRGRLFYVLLAMQPIVIAAELLTQRRSAFAALAAALVVVALMAFIFRPRATLIVLAIGLVLTTGYSAAFWNSSSRLAEPVRFIREVVDPSSVAGRDRSSDAWRDIENSNIAYTVRQLPLTGVGLGQQYLFQQEPPALTTFVYWRYIAHNALLWLWLKAGPFGAFAFWFLVGLIVLRGVQLYRQLEDPFLRVAASFPVLLTVTQVVFSSVDLGLTYNRTMTVLGVALGLAAPLSAWLVSERGLQRHGPIAAEQRRAVLATLGGEA